MIQNPYYLYVNSRERLSGSDTNFTYDVNLPRDVTFDRVVLLDALIPKSYYLVQDNTSEENIFFLKENNTTVTITVPIGSYLLNTFKLTIANLLTTNSPNGLTYTVTYPSTSTQPDTGKFTYTSSNGAIASSIICNHHFFEPLGFQRDSTNVFTGTTLVSSTVLKLQSEDRLLLHSSCVQNGSDDILMSINSSTSVNYSSIVWQNPAPEYYSHTLANPSNNVYSFSLTDEDNEVINTNGLNINFTILFYRIDPIIQQLRDFLKLAVSK